VFVPKGCVLLTAAADRLAEARRTTGQVNDDGKNAARAELRREFHSGSMLATVICPRSGKTHTIYPQKWGRELALTWFEQGECWLTEYLVYPPLGLLYGKERVTIFVSEHDLQRLTASQETIPRNPIADVKARGKDGGGRPSDYRPPEPVKDALCTTYQQSGLPGKPTSKHLLLDKLNERIAANLIEATLESEATWLREWLAKKHPQAPQSGQSAIKNAIRETYNNAKKTT
jgi:hypothetical protein